jgi:hypothetical protein
MERRKTKLFVSTCVKQTGEWEYKGEGPWGKRARVCVNQCSRDYRPESSIPRTSPNVSETLPPSLSVM